ncbi:MAG: homocysteine S-methyltransferase family protein, partial [Gammaproteobacteria bacterium]|nr:homocysteine S-methyltransferase family protein [Gammaproteobacteria bacterium]
MRFLERLKQHVLLCDGGMGTFIQARDWDIERDFLGLENCSEILNITRPDFIQDVHRQYFAAGADCVETNTFGANKVVLAEFDIPERTFELNKAAAILARQVANEFATTAWPRYILGSIGPGTKLASLGHASYDTLVDSYAEQARGLIAGGVDCFLIETNQDLLTIKAAVHACKLALAETNTQLPIFTQVTIESNGSMLVGSDIGCALTSLAALDVDGIGLNCATGPIEMAEHVQYLGENWPGFISVMPNAGLPILIDGKTEYPLTPEELTDWQQRFIEADGVALIGGCCGTTPAHIRALREMLTALSNPAPKARQVTLPAAVSSLYRSVNLRQENAIFAIGERANANGSKHFRELLQTEDFDSMVNVGREQEKQGSHALDVCVAYVGRPEVQDMTEVLTRYRGQITVPLCVDSTELPVLTAALKLLGGKSIINSINFEDGEEKAEAILKLAKQFGCAVVALTIDEQGMAKEIDDKMKIAHRLYDFAVNHFHLPPEDLLFDPLTFTICTGVAEDREHGINTLKAIERIAKELPRCQIMLGLSNISFGLNPAARHVLNSVFLYHAVQAGMTAAIIHVSKIMPLHKIDAEQRQAAENLIFNRWDNGDPLLHFVNMFHDVDEVKTVRIEAITIEEKLAQRIVDGNKQGLDQDLETALQQYSPLDIINNFLLDGMKTVGELFGSGEMQL